VNLSAAIIVDRQPLGGNSRSTLRTPFSAGSVPSLIFKVSTGAFAVLGIAVGK
jgi:hypothetical protein